jgi:hypothetical protein
VANEKPAEYEIVPFPRIRHLVIDVLRVAQRKHMIHGLVEADVTRARQYIREQEANTGEQLSFTAFRDLPGQSSRHEQVSARHAELARAACPL